MQPMCLGELLHLMDGYWRTLAYTKHQVSFSYTHKLLLLFTSLLITTISTFVLLLCVFLQHHPVHMNFGLYIKCFDTHRHKATLSQYPHCFTSILAHIYVILTKRTDSPDWLLQKRLTRIVEYIKKISKNEERANESSTPRWHIVNCCWDCCKS